MSLVYQILIFKLSRAELKPGSKLPRVINTDYVDKDP